MHEQRRGYKVMSINASDLSKDYSHKVQIAEEIQSLVDKMKDNVEIA